MSTATKSSTRLKARRNKQGRPCAVFHRRIVDNAGRPRGHAANGKSAGLTVRDLPSESEVTRTVRRPVILLAVQLHVTLFPSGDPTGRGISSYFGNLSFKIAHPNPPAACPRVVRPCISACGIAYRQTSARMRSTAASDVATYDPPVAICDSLRRKSTRGGRWSSPEQSAQSTTSTRQGLRL